MSFFWTSKNLNLNPRKCHFLQNVNLKPSPYSTVVEKKWIAKTTIGAYPDNNLSEYYLIKFFRDTGREL